MKFQVFTILALQPELGLQALNSFCAQHRIASVEKHFVAQGETSFWSVCVSTLDAGPKLTTNGKRDKIDYREVLNERDFAVYAALRDLRKLLAEQEGIPALA